MRLCAMADVIDSELSPIKRIAPNYFNIMQTNVKMNENSYKCYKN